MWFARFIDRDNSKLHNTLFKKGNKITIEKFIISEYGNRVNIMELCEINEEIDEL